MERRIWSREEFMLVMNLYTKIPYGQFHAKNAEVIQLANILNRTPGAVAYKLVHFASLDPYHLARGIKGLGNPGNNAINIFNEFQAHWDKLLYESELLLIKYQNKTIEEEYLSQDEIKEYRDIDLRQKEGFDIKRMIKTRVNQGLFRKVIIGNYFHTCAVCGVNIPDLLVASHILKWSNNKEERLNPENGICLCNLHDKAFEMGYLGIMPNYKIIISNEVDIISDKTTQDALFKRHHNHEIILPDKYYPNKNFLDLHFQQSFKI